jgi:diacylglycerol kinase (ATP)
MASTNLASATAQPLHEESALPPQQFHPREFSFPWKSNPWDLDWEKAAVATWLFLVCFLILSPDIYNWRLWHLRKRDGSDRIQVLPPEESASPRRVSSTSCSTTVCVGVMGEEEETEEEFFQKHYATIRMSPYRRLVLPPECKRLDRPPVHKPKAAKEVPQIQVYDEDHPLRRLEYYVKNCLELLRSILSYDYASAVRTVSNWLQLILKMRSKKTPEVTEDDDDDLSIASSVTFKSAGAQVQEEKKDEGRTLLRRSSSLYENALCADSGEADVTKSPLGLRQRSLTKKKDALDAYRSAIPGRPPPRSPKSPDPVHTVHFMGERSPPRRQQRETSDGMSYFDAAHSKESLHRLNVEVPVPDQNGYIVGDEFLANSRVTPLLVFVNSRSGPQQGQLLITQLRRLLNPIQIWDLSDGGPEKVLQSFCVMTRLRILVCGGDGTVSWIISALEQMNLPRNPPIAILPLGTGNDLARMHGWGGGYNNESLICILEQVAESYISLLDRWEMTIENRKGKVMMTKSFFNYLGVGVDAQAALQVHMLRESRPKLFFSRVVNKAWYAVFGAEDAIKASHANLPNEIVLIADGVEVPLPDDSQGIILLNIDSYSGGVPMWALGTKPEQSRNSLAPFALQPKYGPRRVHSFEYVCVSFL